MAADHSPWLKPGAPAWQMLWEQFSYSELIDVKDEKEALELYLASIQDNLRALGAERVDGGYQPRATFLYLNKAGTGITTVEVKAVELLS